MHAVITTWSVPRAQLPAQYRDVRARLIQTVEHLPGFVVRYSTVVPNGGTA